MVYYIDSIFLKYSRLSFLHYFLGVLGFKKKINIFSILSLSPHTTTLFIPFDVYFYHLVINFFHSLNNPTTPHEPILWQPHTDTKNTFQFYILLQFFSGQFTSFMYSDQPHFLINSSFYLFPNAFNLSRLSFYACSNLYLSTSLVNVPNVRNSGRRGCSICAFFGRLFFLVRGRQTFTACSRSSTE